MKVKDQIRGAVVATHYGGRDYGHVGPGPLCEYRGSRSQLLQLC